MGTSSPRLGKVEGAHRLHDPAQIDLDPGDHMARVVAIAPQQRKPGKLLFEWQEQALASCLIGALGSCHLDLHQVALAIDQCVSFAPPDFFSPDRSLSQDREPHWF